MYLIVSDIVECATGADNCDTNAVCINTPGGFTCSCNQGYTGEGVTCMGESFSQCFFLGLARIGTIG